MERTAVFAALRWECSPVLRQLRQVTRRRVAEFTVWTGVTPGHEVWLVKTGVGPKRAENAVHFIGGMQRFSCLLSTGCAGALAPELVPGDLTVATAIIANPSGDRFETDADCRARAHRAAERAALRTTFGPVLCSPHVLATAAAKRAAAQCGNVAVEMEGAPIGGWAAEKGIPFASVRVILDTAETELPHAGRFTNPQSGAVKPLVLAGYLATHPSAWPQLRAMQRMMHTAQSSLDRFFSAWFAER